MKNKVLKKKTAKKSLLVILGALSALGIAAGAAACAHPDDNGGTLPAETEINGFEVKESLTVQTGAVVNLEELFVTDSTGAFLDCWWYVTDGDGHYVESQSGNFTAANEGVYTIVYVVRDSLNNVYEKKTLVTVTALDNGNDSKSEIRLKAEFEQFVSVGDTIEIKPICSDKSATFAYTVVDTENNAVELRGNEFTPTETGIYRVKITANGGEASYTYDIFAEEKAGAGEVEAFNGCWVQKEAFIGGKRSDWQIVTTENGGISDRYGRNVSMAKYTTQKQYIPLYINIRNDCDYYEQLASEGYTYVSMWIYAESEKPHSTVSDRDQNGGFYRRNGPYLYPGQWAEFQLDLVTGKTTWYRSFVQCYNLYANQNHFYLQVDNSNEDNPWGNEREITMYFTDIYAVKPVEVQAADNVQTELSAGATVNLSECFSASEGELAYSVTYRGETVAIDGENYTFAGNGEYEITAYPADKNYAGEASIKFSVSDNFSLGGEHVIKERKNGSVSVSLSEFGNVAFNEAGGVTPVLSGDPIVTYNGEAISVQDGAFSAAKDGIYELEYKGEYEADGKKLVSWQKLSADVWSAQTKYDVIDPNNMRSLRAWDWDAAITDDATYGEYTVGGKTGYFVKTTANGQSLTMYAKPMYTKQYYEALKQENGDLSVAADIYFIPEHSASTGTTSNFRSILTATYVSGHTTWKEAYENNWVRLDISLDKFLSQYDAIAERYEYYKNAAESNGVESAEGAWLYMIGTKMSRTMYIHARVAEKTSEIAVELKNGAEIAVGESNDLNEIFNVTVGGEKGEITKAEVQFNGKWTELTDKTFMPVWNTEYLFRFVAETADGSKFGTIEKSFVAGDGAFEVTEDKGVHTLTGDKDFDLKTLISGDYTLEIEAFSIRGKSSESVDAAEGTVIKGERLPVGAYRINIYAINGDGDFAKILYYTLTLDKIGEDSLSWIDKITADNFKKQFNSYQWAGGDQGLTCTTVTTDCPEGNAGSFIKYEGVPDKTKEAMRYATKPLLSKGYYASLANSADKYVLKFDVFVENVNSASARTTILYYAYNSKGELGTDGNRMDLGKWYTMEIPLETLVNAWSDSTNDTVIFGVYIGIPTSDLVRMWIGNIKLEKVPAMWSAATLTKGMLTSYQYGSSQNLTDISLTEEIPEGGVAGTYVKYAQTVEKQDIQLAVAPVFGEDYYKALIAGGAKYKIVFDVYVTASRSDCTQLATKLWTPSGFGSSTKVTLNQWHTVEVDLQYLVDNWGNHRLFGLNFCSQTNFDRSVDRATFYLGNIRLAKGEANGVITTDN